MKKIRILLVMALLVATTSLGSVFAQDEMGTIVDVAAGNEDFSTLVSLVEAAGLVDALSAEDATLTVFAPTNDAFDALPTSAVVYLQNNPDLLAQVIQYHALPSVVTSMDIAEGTAETLQGETIDIRPQEDGLRINDARVTATDIEASNGVIHVINTVLIPPVFDVPAADPLSQPSDSSVVTAGSSTVFPLAERIAALYEEAGYAGEVSVDSIGSGGGFERFCEQGETDVSNASRPISESEIQACAQLEDPRSPTGFTVATDALAVTVNVENDFVDNLTFEQLAAIFSNEANTWADVNPEWPAEDILLYSPGTDSGTYDFFVEAVFDEDEGPIQNAPNIEFSEDDNVLVQGVEGSQFAIGYFGFAYYSENTDQLKAVSIEGVPPTPDTGASGEYPLSRPLFIYSDAGIVQNQSAVADYIAFFLNSANDELGTGEGQIAYIPTNPYIQTRNAFFYNVLTSIDEATLDEAVSGMMMEGEG